MDVKKQGMQELLAKQTSPMFENLEMLRKTSKSGDTYLIIVAAESINCALFAYNFENHSTK